MSNHTIIKQKYQTPLSEEALCAFCGICGAHSEQNNMTVGPYDERGNLTFICVDHFRSQRQLIGLLATFITAQGANGEGTDAWFLR